MWFSQQDESEDRTGGADYYNRITVENEFRVKSDQHAIENEVKRRFSRHFQKKQDILEQRREKLAELLQCEAKLYEELCRQKLKELEKEHKDALFNEAEKLQQKLRERESKLAADLYAKRHILQDSTARERAQRKHMAEIMNDWEYIAKMKEQDNARAAEEDRYLQNMKSHFEEQLEREEEEKKKNKLMRQNLSKEYESEMERKKQDKVEQRENEKEEYNKSMEYLNQKYQHQEKKIDPAQLRADALKQIHDTRNAREQKQHTEEIVDQFCNPVLEGVNREQINKDKEKKRKEYLQFLDYQQRVRNEEECKEKQLDHEYIKIANELEQKRRDRQKLERERLENLAKEIVAEQKKRIAQKDEQRIMEREKVAQEGKLLMKQLEEYKEQVKMEERKRREKQQRFMEDVEKLNSRTNEIRAQLKAEAERERAAMVLAEMRYKESLDAAIRDNPLRRQLHPWRKRLMNNR